MAVQAITENFFSINGLSKWVPIGPSEQLTEKAAPERRFRQHLAALRGQQLRPEYCDIKVLSRIVPLSDGAQPDTIDQAELEHLLGRSER